MEVGCVCLRVSIEDQTSGEAPLRRVVCARNHVFLRVGEKTMTRPLKGAKPMRSDKTRKLPESPMGWSECPICGEPFSDCPPGPLPGQTTYVHSNGVRHIDGASGTAVPTSSPVTPQPTPEKTTPFSGASGSSTKIPAIDPATKYCHAA